MFFFYFQPQHLPQRSAMKWMQGQAGGDGWMDEWSGFVLTLRVVETAGLQLLYGSKVEHDTHLRRLHVP